MILNQLPSELTTFERNYIFRKYVEHCVLYNIDRSNIVYIYKGYYLNLHAIFSGMPAREHKNWLYVEYGKVSEFKPQPKIRNRDKYLRDKLRRVI